MQRKRGEVSCREENGPWCGWCGKLGGKEIARSGRSGVKTTGLYGFLNDWKI